MLLGLPVVAQTPAGPEFEVSSIKLFQRQAGQRPIQALSCMNGRFLATYESVPPIVRWAYNIEDFQIYEMPKWASDAPYVFFDIEAKAASDTTEAQYRLMVQKLVAERFKLVAHREMRSVPAYALAVGKNGIKMKLATPADEGLGAKITINGSPMQAPPGSSKDLAPPIGFTMAQLIGVLTLPLGIPPPGEQCRPIVDKTGLQGQYRFSLDFGMGVAGFPMPDGFTDVFTAVRQQLGLELQQVYGAV